MVSLLHQLLFDLKERCSYLWAELQRLKHTLPVEAQPYRDRMVQLLASSSQRIEALINDPGIRDPHFARNYYYDYIDQQFNQTLGMSLKPAPRALRRLSEPRSKR